MANPILNPGIPQQAVPVVTVPGQQNNLTGGPQPNQQPQQPSNQPKPQQPSQPNSSANSVGFIVVDAIIMDPRGQIPVKRIANAQDASLPLIETDNRGRLVIQGAGGNIDNGNQFNVTR